ncbi:hypothetical protein [Arundinibacter roseus]|uniref:DUF3037 domain-containing protein n=1 Tax=Arundinibacter roseus TaxID=2070510 RepID=A0A4R4KMB9_9BACT|nr:hypothetical protein [Arundinibacter roseus]TDB69143.1 hypothetical protein EZE20_02065 [Arundinibacter roseus]
MSSFYSIVYVNIRPALGERVSIALLLRDEQNLLFHQAPEKLEALKTILPSEAYNLARTLIKNLDSLLSDSGIEDTRSEYQINLGSDKQAFTEKSYLSYLSAYGNNLLTFSEPRTIDIPTTQETFTRLFQKYVHTGWESSQRQSTRTSLVKYVREMLYPKVKDRVNLDAVITTEMVPGLVAPTKVNLAGRNEVNMIGQIVDFEKKKPGSLADDINRVLALVRAFEEKNDKGKYFIIGREPKKELSEQHAIWENVRDLPTLDFVADTETDRIGEYIEEHNVQPLIPVSFES